MKHRTWPALVLGFALAIGAAGCGPSSGQVKTARTATYRADADTVFRAVVAAVAKDYKVINADAPGGMLRTEDRWYEQDGSYEDKTADNDIMAADGSIVMHYVVKLAGGPTDYKVEVLAMVAQVRTGYAAPVRLQPDDIGYPGWVLGKTDNLYLAIYESLKPYAVAPAASAGS
jgi:hypothetical protein